MARHPGLTIVLVSTLAIGIGATTAVFGVVHAALLRALPFSDPDRLMVLDSWRGANELGVSWLDYADWRVSAGSFSELACYLESEVHLTLADGSDLKLGATTSTRNLFTALRIQPILGRGFLAKEAVKGAPPVVLLSYALWSQRFGADRGVVGRSVRIGGMPHIVVGVMPPGFRFPSKADLWLPLEPFEGDNPRSLRALSVLGRLRPGVSIQQAHADMTRIASQLAAQFPATNSGVGTSIVPLSAFWVKDLRPALLLLLGVCGCLLLITCANVANLLLARATARQMEISLRTALGAGPRRILRQLLTESLVLALAGGAAGLLLASWGTRVLAMVIADSRSLEVPFWIDLSLNGVVLSFALAVSLLVGLLFGLAPALTAARVHLVDSLKEGGRGAAGGRSAVLRHLLAVTEVALALTLLIGAGLLGKSLLRMWEVAPGFQPRHLLTVTAGLPFYNQTDRPGRAALFREAHRRLESLPGVVAVGASSSLPLSGEETWTRMAFVTDTQPEEQRIRNPEANLERISPSYFEAMKIPLLEGRYFDPHSEVPGAPATLIVNKKLAELLWPGQDPLGKRLNLGKGTPTASKKWWTVVGVVGDVKHRAIGSDPGLDIYVSYFQFPSFDSFTFVLRTRTEVAGLPAAARAAISGVSPDLEIDDVQTMQQMVNRSLWHARLWGLLFDAFSMVALILAAIGIYGVMSYNISQRTREMGVRAALGADRTALARLLLGQGMKLASAGVACGLLGAFWLSRALSSLLYQVSAADPLIYLEITVALSAVVVVAIWIPTRRVLQIEPVAALRAE